MTRKENDEKCRYCHKPGHKENVCYKKQRNMAHHTEEESEDEYALITEVNIPKSLKDANIQKKIYMTTNG